MEDEQQQHRKRSRAEMAGASADWAITLDDDDSSSSSSSSNEALNTGIHQDPIHTPQTVTTATAKATTTATATDANTTEITVPPPPRPRYVPLLSERASACWVCETVLTVPKSEYAYYTKHAHPVLATASRAASTTPSTTDNTTKTNAHSIHSQNPEESNDNDEYDEDDIDTLSTTPNIPLFVCFCCVGLFDNNDDPQDGEDETTSSTASITDHTSTPLSSATSAAAASVKSQPSARTSSTTAGGSEESSSFSCALCLQEDSVPCASCPTCALTICQVCRAVCHGGGTTGWINSQKALVVASKSAAHQSPTCPVCQPPPPLQQWAFEYAREQQRSEQASSSSSSATEETLELHAAVQDEHARTLLRLDALDQCLEALDAMGWGDFLIQQPPLSCDRNDNGDYHNISAALSIDVHEWYATLWREVSVCTSADDAREYLRECRDEQLAHEARVGDTLAHLQESLETIHGCDMAFVCEHVLQQPKAVPPETEEAYVRAAHKAIDERNAKERQQALEKQEAKKARDGSEDDDDDDDDSVSATGDLAKAGWIDDVEIDSTGDEHEDDGEISQSRSIRLLKPRAKGFEGRWPRMSESKKKMQRLLDREQAIIQQYHIPLAKVREREDATENLKREIKRSKQGCDVEYAQLPQVRRRRKANAARQKQAQKKSSASSSNSTSQKRRASTQKELTPPARKKTKRDVTPSPFEGAQFPESKSLLTSTHDIFQNSTLILPGSQAAVARDLATKLKPHQVQAVHCMWNNAFADCNTESNMNVGGCILAHHMGTGKTLSAIALIQAVYLHRLAKRVLLVVPKNVVENWKNEFQKWIGDMEPFLAPTSIASVSEKNNREATVKQWAKSQEGGILLVSKGQVGSSEYLLEADLVVIDEAHEVLKNKRTKTYSLMSLMKTKRKIALTGTPLQNDLIEYYHMVDFLRPRLLGPFDIFEREFAIPIAKGFMTDCPEKQYKKSLKQTATLYKKLDPHMDRQTASILARELPPMQQTVLYVRKSNLQKKLFQKFRHYQKQASNGRNFFGAFACLKPIHNHPGCLLVNRDDEESDTFVKSFWRSVLEWNDEASISKVEEGLKIVIVLHILVQAHQRGEKTVIFSQCLKTLDFLEKVLESPDWREHSESLAHEIGYASTYGGWKKGQDYMRIDGTVSSSKRGDHISNFDTDDNVRAFLLSSKAGGVGINLVAANRVVLMDAHFNPAVSEQAIFRCYRYGQTKPVFVYRLLTEASMEEKVYARTVTKTGLAKCVIDKKAIEQVFSSRELEDLQAINNWAQCDNCDKWRLLPDSQNDNVAELPQWFCEMNQDVRHNSCDAPERDEAWYEKDRARQWRISKGQSSSQQEEQAAANSLSLSAEEMKHLEDQDPILQHILNIQGRPVSKHIFHEVLTKEKEFNLDAVEVHDSDDSNDKKPPAKVRAPDGSASASASVSADSASLPSIKQETVARAPPKDPPGEVECIVLSSDEGD